ncbi:hypothetical protein AB6A40_009230 [Gnathostoma spinigerum]|uniref:Uncharacterized protein n=1 Tax=Gnathostoma spinigerum TaxID=75299 RepID=A0ABD6ERP0_9BILA
MPELQFSLKKMKLGGGAENESHTYFRHYWLSNQRSAKFPQMFRSLTHRSPRSLSPSDTQLSVPPIGIFNGILRPLPSIYYSPEFVAVNSITPPYDSFGNPGMYRSSSMAHARNGYSSSGGHQLPVWVIPESLLHKQPPEANIQDVSLRNHDRYLHERYYAHHGSGSLDEHQYQYFPRTQYISEALLFPHYPNHQPNTVIYPLSYKNYLPSNNDRQVIYLI